MNMKKILKITAILLFIIFLTGCSETKNTKIKEDLLGIDFSIDGNTAKLDGYSTTNPVVAMYIEKYGAVVIELYKDVAPNTVSNFASLVESGFYDNNTFHRLMPGFVLQGGDPTGTGMGGPEYTIAGEFSVNNFENDLKHEKGIVSMARNSISYDSAGSQFFIMLDDASYLDGQYAAFGKVIDGWKNIENIVENEKVADQETGQLETNLVLKKAVIDLKENELSPLKTIEEN